MSTTLATQPKKSSTLRNQISSTSSASSSTSSDEDEQDSVQIIDSPPPPPAPATTSTTIESITPAKGRYERPNEEHKKLTRGGLAAAIDAAISDRINKPGTPSSSAQKGTATPDSKSQFEQQEDFISFDASPPPPPASRGRFSVNANTSAKGSKRKLDEFEEKKEEKTRRVQKREKERTTPWLDEPGVDWRSCDSAIAMLNAEAHAFITYISPTLVEHELRIWTIELIRRTIKSRYSDADVECFGSVGTGLYLPGGDIDLVVLCPSFPSPPAKPTSSLLHSLASLLLTSSLAEPSSLLVIAKARVPIVKFVTRYGGFSVDLSVNQGNGVAAAARVKDMLETFAFRDENDRTSASASTSSAKGKKVAPVEVDPLALSSEVDHGAARSLVLLVKAFLNQRGMNEVFTGGLGSYSIICLVVSFLQLHPKIQSGQINPARNIGLLFVEFLEYYGRHYNYDECGISIRGKGAYFNKHDRGWWRQNQPFLLSIEDPNDLTNDVSGGSHNIVRVRQTLAGAFEVLSATLLQRVSVYALIGTDKSSARALSLLNLPSADPDARDPLCQSVLGSVIGMSRAGIRSRRDNVDLHSDGILQDLIERGPTKPLAGNQKRALQKLRKEEKEKGKQEKTIARLEQRALERTAKGNRKERRRLEQLEKSTISAAKREAKKTAKKTKEGIQAQDNFVSLGSGGGADAEIEDASDIEEGEIEQRPLARTLFGNNKSTSTSTTNDSRYSISASPAPNGKGRQKVVEEIYIGSDSSDDEDDDENDDDVILGGNIGGDSLMSKSSMTMSNGQSLTITSSNSSEDSSSEEEEEDGESVARLLQQPKLKKQKKSSSLSPKESEIEKTERKAKSEARSAFWATKGKRLEDGEADDFDA